MIYVLEFQDILLTEKLMHTCRYMPTTMKGGHVHTQELKMCREIFRLSGLEFSGADV